MRHLSSHHTMASTVPLRNKSDYIIPLSKSPPGLPRVARVQCRLRTMTPVTKPLCQGHSLPPHVLLSASSCEPQVPWHFCPPSSQVCSHPGLGPGSSFCLKYVVLPISEGLPASQSKHQSSTRPFLPALNMVLQSCCPTLYSSWHPLVPENISVVFTMSFL